LPAEPGPHQALHEGRLAAHPAGGRGGRVAPRGAHAPGRAGHRRPRPGGRRGPPSADQPQLLRLRLRHPPRPGPDVPGRPALHEVLRAARGGAGALPPTRRRPHHRRDQLTAVPFTVQRWWYHPPQPTRLPISLPLANRCRAVRVGGPKRNGDLMNFRRVDASQFDWEGMWRLRGWAFAHTRGWLEFASGASNGEPVYAVLEAGGRVLGYFTGSIVRRFGLRLLASPGLGWTTPYVGLVL